MKLEFHTGGDFVHLSGQQLFKEDSSPYRQCQVTRCRNIHCLKCPVNTRKTWKCVIPVVCVKIGKGMQSNTTMSIKIYLMTILDNYMFRLLLAIFRLSSRELKVLLYILCAHNIYSRTLSSLEDNLKMASRSRNMQLSSIVIKTS